MKDHPTRDELLALVFGGLSDEQAKTVAEHVEECPVCGDTVRELDTASDDLIHSLRRPAAVDAYLEEFDCQKFVGLVSQLGQERSGVATPPAPDPTSIRDYEILAKIDEGGMGAVYKARHTGLDRLVALKLLPPERLKRPGAVARFQREWKAVAKLQHPSIVHAYDAGQHEGQYFLAMEYVEGWTLSGLVRQLGPLPIADACELIRQAAVALQHAHEHGLVHRDVKPSNLMLAIREQAVSGQHSAASHSAIVKVLDLGLALINDEPQGELTSSGQLMGTLDYMAPEQTGGSHDVDIRADVYGLGATLYKLLAGRAPFDQPQFNTTGKKLAALERDPVPALDAYCSDVPVELQAALMKMLAKSPADRFATPREVAEALAPWASTSDLSALAVRAADSSTSAREQVERSRAGTDHYLSSSFVDTHSDLVPIVSASTTDTSVSRSLVERPSQPSDRPRSKWPLVTGLGFVAAALALVIYLATDRGEIRITSFDPKLEVTIKRNDRVVDGFQVQQRPDGVSVYSGEYQIELQGGTPNGVTVKNDKFQLSRGDTVLVEIVQVEDNASVAAIGSSSDAIAWRRGSYDPAFQGIIPRPAKFTGIKRWQLETTALRTAAHTVDWSPDGQRIAVRGESGAVRIYKAENLELECVLNVIDSGVVGGTDRVEWSPDGTQIVTAGRTVQIWSVSGELLREIPISGQDVNPVNWSPDGLLLAIADSNDRVLICTADGNLATTFASGPVYELEWSPDGKSIAVAHRREHIRIFDANGTLIREMPSSDVVCLAWSPDSKVVATGCEDKIRFWNVDGTAAPTVDHEGSVHDIAWNHETNELATAGPFLLCIWGSDGTLLQRETCASIGVDGGNICCVDWAPDGKQLAGVSQDGSLFVVSRGQGRMHVLCGSSKTSTSNWDIMSFNPSGDQLAVMLPNSSPAWIITADGTRQERVLGDFHSLSWHPNGKLCAVTSRGDLVQFDNLTSPLAVLPKDIVRVQQWSTNGNSLVTGSLKPGHLNVFDRVTRKFSRIADAPVASVSWSPDSEWFAAAQLYGTVKLWKPDGTEGVELLNPSTPFDVAIAPEGKLIAVGYDSGKIVLWNIDGSEVATFNGPQYANCVAWGPDSENLVSGHNDGTVRIWNVEQGETQRLRGHHNWVTQVEWSRDDRRIASMCHNNTVIVWDAQTGEPEWTAVFLPNDQLATFSGAGELLTGDPKVVEREFVVMVEQENGRIELLKPSEFKLLVSK